MGTTAAPAVKKGNFQADFKDFLHHFLEIGPEYLQGAAEKIDVAENMLTMLPVGMAGGLGSLARSVLGLMKGQMTQAATKIIGEEVFDYGNKVKCKLSKDGRVFDSSVNIEKINEDIDAEREVKEEPSFKFAETFKAYSMEGSTPGNCVMEELGSLDAEGILKRFPDGFNIQLVTVQDADEYGIDTEEGADSTMVVGYLITPPGSAGKEGVYVGCDAIEESSPAFQAARKVGIESEADHKITQGMQNAPDLNDQAMRQALEEQMKEIHPSMGIGV